MLHQGGFFRRGTGTGSFSIAPANTYGGYYGAGSYSLMVAFFVESMGT